MGFIVLCVIYIAVCKGICHLLNLEDLNKQAWVYAIVGAVWSFIFKNLLS